MENNWINTGVAVRMTGSAKTFTKLDNGIYELKRDDNGFFLEIYADEFKFPHKIYGVENDFINRVTKTYGSLEGNIGVLLNGLKGTGKSVTAKLLCNALQLPVILISSKMDGAESFIKDINQEIIVFVDEYEKIYKTVERHGQILESDSSFLSLMDGALSGIARRLFLLTTNSDKIDENLKSRPGRIRYAHNYTDLSVEVIREIVSDLLEDKTKIDALTEELSELEMITIDIVKSIVEECNIHGELLSDFIKFFNVTKTQGQVFLSYVDDKEETKPFSDMPLDTFKRTIKEGHTLTSRRGRGFDGLIDNVDWKTQIVHIRLYDEDKDEYVNEMKLNFNIIATKHRNFISAY